VSLLGKTYYINIYMKNVTPFECQSLADYATYCVVIKVWHLSKKCHCLKVQTNKVDMLELCVVAFTYRIGEAMWPI
jgi:hypothetical protein